VVARRGGRVLRRRGRPLRLACRTPGGRLRQVALWCRYREGRFECATSADAEVVEILRAEPGVAVDVSTNEPPSRGSGTAPRRSTRSGEELLVDLLERDLGGTESVLAGRLLADDREEVRVAVDPDRVTARVAPRVTARDYTDRMAGEGE
jgi:hypothetical protein